MTPLSNHRDNFCYINYLVISYNYIKCRSVKVTLEAEQKVEIMLVLSYVVSNASWTPAYDVRVFTKDKTMKVEIIIDVTFHRKQYNSRHNNLDEHLPLNAHCSVFYSLLVTKFQRFPVQNGSILSIYNTTLPIIPLLPTIPTILLLPVIPLNLLAWIVTNNGKLLQPLLFYLSYFSFIYHH